MLGIRNVFDVIVLEFVFVKKYVELGLMVDLGEYGLEEVVSDIYLYVKDVGISREGILYVLVW